MCSTTRRGRTKSIWASLKKAFLQTSSAVFPATLSVRFWTSALSNQARAEPPSQAKPLKPELNPQTKPLFRLASLQPKLGRTSGFSCTQNGRQVSVARKSYTGGLKREACTLQCATCKLHVRFEVLDRSHRPINHNLTVRQVYNL